MKDLRIIVVSWNVEQSLERCLKPLPEACAGLAWDCVTVDNASRDGSAAVARRFSNVRVIQNKDNRGFAKACNQGLVDLDARFVLLLNPDTECPPRSLLRLVEEASAHQDAGIFGPKLLNSDGSAQASIRRFPAFWSQLGIMLKLHNAFPGLFRRYFASDLSLEAEQDADQVMGSCFLIRREVIEALGGLDERYFLWFEEVDYCRMAKERGWRVRYIPSVSVTHHGGKSFGQVLSLSKQRFFNDSLAAYFKKWEPGWKSSVLNTIRPLSLALAWIAGVIGLVGSGSRRVLHKEGAAQSGMTWISWAICILILEIISALTIFRPIWNSAATLVAGLVVGLMAWKRPHIALSVLFLELFIGGKGYLLQLGWWPDTISLRIVLFVVFMFGWVVNAIETGAWRRIPDLLKGWREWILLYVLVVYGVARGMALGNGPVFADANAWGFVLLLIPTLDIATRYGRELREVAVPVLIIAPVWLAIKTLGLEYIYSHGIQALSEPSYLWVRRTGVGEVTLVTANAFRIFMQSYVFVLPAFLFGVSYYFATHEKELKRSQSILYTVLVSSFVILAISLSRSLWIGAATGMMTITWFYVRGAHRAPLRVFANAFIKFVGLGVVSLVLIFTTLAFPIPRVDVASLATLFGSRVSTEDAAAVSRWRLLDVLKTKIAEHPVLGSGFGATVTYETKDPRIVAQTGGLYTTYAFEWGWLEHWVKFGLLGPILILVLIWRLGRRLSRLNEPRWIVVGSLATLTGLAVTHFFTPYLNHPLGLGMLMAMEVVVVSSRTVRVETRVEKNASML